MGRAYKCDECGALAEEMEIYENFMFRYKNGDHKLQLSMGFARPHGHGRMSLCLSCKIKFLKQSIERLQKQKESQRR